MFAVIKTGGKQYRVEQDQEIVIEKLEGDAGDTLVFGEVLMIGDGDKVDVGAPLLSGAQVVGEVVDQTRAAKIIIFKKKPRNTYRRKKGHRQHQTVIRITDILAKGGAQAKKGEGKKAAPKAEAKGAAKPAAKAAPKADEGGDNLTKLTGVGKVAATKLNEEGITTFAQVAGLSAAKFADLDEKIFKGRVPMDQLVSEAKDLAKG
jgi:large subunit ribosomal protein L21